MLTADDIELRKATFDNLANNRVPHWAKAEDAELFARIVASFKDDALGFVRWAFPWGVPGTRLEHATLEPWQIRILLSMTKQIEAKRHTIRIAVASGHGIGKSALIAMIIIWFLATHPNPQIVVTANTEQQLKNKTWREVSVWLQLSLVSWMLKWTATKVINIFEPSTWFASAVPWSESNSEAFAGTHEEHVLILFDEASKIPAPIWETAYGALTTEGAMMVAFGNPTMNSGYFYDCFGKNRKRWSTLRVDSREVSFTNKHLIREWEEDYGEDSDYFRVRVKGLHPLQSSLQFIPGYVVNEAMAHHIRERDIPLLAPKIMGVDIARHGDDHTVLLWRKAKKVLHHQRFQIPDLMMVARKVAAAINETQPDVVFIDAQGMGAGVYDRLVQLGYEDTVVPVYWGKKAQEDKVYVNNRVECWARMKQWLEGADIPDDAVLREELISPEFGYERQSERLRLETKSEMKKRGLESPDVADALALTFAEHVPPKKDVIRGSNMTEPEAA